MSFRRKSPGSHAEAQIKNHSRKNTPRNAKTQASHIRVRLMFLELLPDGDENVQPDGESLLALAHVWAGGFILMNCQVRRKPRQKPYVRLSQEEARRTGTPYAIPRAKKLVKTINKIILNAWEDAQSLRGEVHVSSTFIVLSEPPFGESWEGAL